MSSSLPLLGVLAPRLVSEVAPEAPLAVPAVPLPVVPLLPRAAAEGVEGPGCVATQLSNGSSRTKSDLGG